MPIYNLPYSLLRMVHVAQAVGRFVLAESSVCAVCVKSGKNKIKSVAGMLHEQSCGMGLYLASLPRFDHVLL